MTIVHDQMQPCVPAYNSMFTNDNYCAEVRGVHNTSVAKVRRVHNTSDVCETAGGTSGHIARFFNAQR